MDPFKNIRPYTDAEVAGVLQSLVNNPSVLKALIGFQFPGILAKAPFVKFFVKQKLISQIKTIHTIDDYQMIFKDLMEKVVKESIASFEVNGLEKLNKNENHLYISNHRDISLDAALLALHLHKSGFRTFNIAVGNNLMEESWASDLFRLNKSFIIQRSGGTKKEIYSGLSLASQFIYQSIFRDNTSVWIAQKQGRAKDGVDSAEKAVISYGGVQMGQLEKNVSWISLFIALAPMLGFMGTVIGMITAFDRIEAAGDMQPSLVAGGIKVALLTTVFCLIVAIILQVFYNYIVAKIDSIVNDMEDASITLIDILSAQKK